MYRPLSNNDLAAIASELLGTDDDLRDVMSELGFDMYCYGASTVAAWLHDAFGLVYDDRWVLE
jgi:hypothetical protein